jgi:hypothetical protein
MRFLLIVLATLAASGCAIGNKHNYTADPPTMALEGARSVAVVAQDARPYVVNKQKNADFVGIQRGGFGNPFDVTTESGKPLADDFASTISRSLQNRGFKSTAVNVAPSTSTPDVRALAAQARVERVALVSIHEWKSDTFQNTALHYELVLRVYDANGAELASNRVTGSDNLGGSAWNPPDHAKGAVPQAYRKKLAELFGADSVRSSLR